MNIKYLVTVVVFICIFFLVSCTGGKYYKVGTYQGQADGNMGPVLVEVSIDKNGKIANINILEYSDTPGISDTVFDVLSNTIVENQSTVVDTVSGATFTSKAVLEAVNIALKKAK